MSDRLMLTGNPRCKRCGTHHPPPCPLDDPQTPLHKILMAAMSEQKTELSERALGAYERDLQRAAQSNQAFAMPADVGLKLISEVRRHRQASGGVGMEMVERARDFLKAHGFDDGKFIVALAREFTSIRSECLEECAKVARGNNPAGAFSTAIEKAILSLVKP